MIIFETNSKLFKIIKKCACKSIKKSKSKEQWERGIGYLEDHYLFDLPIYRNLQIVYSLKKNIPRNSKVLDWGCGYGDISYLLKNKRPDLKIQLYDIFYSNPWKTLIKKAGLDKILSRDQKKIPFGENSFDAIIAAGVLEHVEDQECSLAELYRILKPKGQLFVYLYPNSFSYTEKFQKLIGNPYHNKALRMNELKSLLKKHGFEIKKEQYNFMLPLMLCRFPYPIRYIYNIFGNLILALNLILEKIPLVNRLSSNLSIVCYKE